MTRFLCHERSQHTDVLASGYVLDGVINVETIEVSPKGVGLCTSFFDRLVEKARRGKCSGVRVFDAGEAVTKIVVNLGFEREIGDDWRLLF